MRGLCGNPPCLQGADSSGVERWPYKPDAGGSKPSPPTTDWLFSGSGGVSAATIARRPAYKEQPVSKPPAHLGLHHVAVFVSDMAAARHFYVELLGFREEWEPDADNLYLTSGADNLALHRGDPPAGKQRL